MGKPGRGTLQCLALFCQEGVFFPPDMSFFYSMCLLAQFLPFPPLVCCFVSSCGEVDKLGNLQELTNDQLWNIFCLKSPQDSFQEWDKSPAAEYIPVISSPLGRANRDPGMAKLIHCYFSSQETSGNHSWNVSYFRCEISSGDWAAISGCLGHSTWDTSLHTQPV